MKQLVTTGIILTRTDFGEADRILTMLTPDQGKVRLVAKGVRRVRSKLAGGIELFSVSSITYSPGRGELGTLVSTRLIKHYRHIVKDIERTMLGYELIKQLNRITEDDLGPEYFELLEQSFEALDDEHIDIQLIKLWFSMQLLRLNGYTPNLHTDKNNVRLDASQTYSFSFDDAVFTVDSMGRFQADQIKFLRLGFSGNSPHVLGQVRGVQELVVECGPMVNTMTTTFLRI